MGTQRADHVVGVVMGGWGEFWGGGGEERDVSLRTGEAVAQALEERGTRVERITAGSSLDRDLRSARIDVAFLALHGRLGEDGTVQGLCELLGLPYTGSGVLASALAMDKPMAKKMLRFHNLPTPCSYVVGSEGVADLEARHGDMGFPCVVKPASSGSSFGLSLVTEVTQLAQAIQKAQEFGGRALVERFVPGREVTVAILEGEVLGSCHVGKPSEVFTTEAKYGSRPRSITAHQLSETRKTNVETLALGAYQALGCRGLARIDLISSDTDNDFLLEVNTLPGLTATSLAPKIAAARGWTFGELCERIVASASLDNHRPPPILRVAV